MNIWGRHPDFQYGCRQLNIRKFCMVKKFILKLLSLRGSCSALDCRSTGWRSTLHQLYCINDIGDCGTGAGSWNWWLTGRAIDPAPVVWFINPCCPQIISSYSAESWPRTPFIHSFILYYQWISMACKWEAVSIFFHSTPTHDILVDSDYKYLTCAAWWNQWYFRPRFCTCKAILDWGQCCVMNGGSITNWVLSIISYNLSGALLYLHSHNGAAVMDDSVHTFILH